MDCQQYVNLNVSSRYRQIPLSIKVEDTPKQVVFHFLDNTDQRILPVYLQEMRIYDIRIRLLESWIINNVFNYMYSHINPICVKTTDVRIRIAVNQINKLQSLPPDAKLAWINWLCELYKVRLKAAMDYYLYEIVKIPFLLGLRSLS